MAETTIKFRYFRSVEGRAVPRYGSASGLNGRESLIGARRIRRARDERLSGMPTIEWDAAIVLLPESWCVRYSKELRNHLKAGDLIEVTEADYQAEAASPSDKDGTK